MGEHYMNIRKATSYDLDAIEKIYNEIHTAEESGRTTIGWIRGVYPTRKTAEDSILRGDMFVLEDEKIIGAGMINQTQVDGYFGAPWRFDSNAVCVLHTLVISPKEAGKGYGRASLPRDSGNPDRSLECLSAGLSGNIGPGGTRPVCEAFASVLCLQSSTHVGYGRAQKTPGGSCPETD